jgi:hypothetical protein
MCQPAAAKGSRLRDRIYQIMPQISSTQHPACQRRRPTIYGADRATPLTLPPVAPENNRIACSRALVPGAGLEPTRPCGQGILGPDTLILRSNQQQSTAIITGTYRYSTYCRLLLTAFTLAPLRAAPTTNKCMVSLSFATSSFDVAREPAQMYPESVLGLDLEVSPAP